MAPDHCLLEHQTAGAIILNVASTPSTFVLTFQPTLSNDYACTGYYPLPPAPSWSEIQRRYWEFVHGHGPFPSGALGPSCGRRPGHQRRCAPAKAEARKGPGRADRAHRRAVRRLLENT